MLHLPLCKLNSGSSSLSRKTVDGKSYSIAGNAPNVPEQPKKPEPASKQAEVDQSVGRKRTASNAELDIPTSKKIKTDASGAILLDDDDDDDLVLL